MMRRIFVFLLTICFATCSYGQATILQRGDLAVVAVNANYNSAKDEISFVCFKDITNGTEIQILDAGYENCLSGLWSCGQEGGAKMVRTGGTIPAGTVMTFRTDPVAFVYPDANWAVSDLFVSSNGNYSVLANGNSFVSGININSNGDQIYFAQGGVWSEQSSLCTIATNRTSPNAIFPGNNGRVLFGFSTNGWSSLQQSSSESGLYPGMQCFSMSPTGGTAYNKYTGPLTAATQTAWIARISNTSNWTTYSSTANYYAASPVYNVANFTIPITPGGGIPTATWTAPASALCSDGTSIILNSLITGTTGGTWSGTGVTGSTFNPTGLNGNYDITYTIQYNSGSATCPIAQTSTITVVQSNAPTVTSSSIAYCQNASSTQLSATGTNLLWYTVPTLGTGSSTAPTPSTLAVGTTNYYVSQTINGCESPRTNIKVSVNSSATINAVSNQTVCANTATAAINFTGNGNAIYNWTNNTSSIGLAASGIGNIASFTAVNSGTTPVTATITATPVAVSYAYVANYGSPFAPGNSVSVVNVNNGTVVGNITVGNNPFGVSVNKDGSRVYITNYGSNSVSVINTANNTVIATIGVGNQPMGVAVTPDGTTLYVANQNTFGSQGSVSVINLVTNTVIATIPAYIRPLAVAISPDGTKAYVCNVNSNNVIVINTATNSVTNVIAVGNEPTALATSIDGSKLYVANFSSNYISVINTNTNTVATTILAGQTGFNGLAVSPDNTKLYATNQSFNNFSIINTAANTVAMNVATGPNTAPHGISFNTDGTKAYIACPGPLLIPNNTVFEWNTTNNILTSITVGSVPHSLGNFITPKACDGAPITFTITVNPLPVTPVANVTQQPTCSTPTGTITVSSPVGTGITYSIDGTNFQAGTTFTNLSAGSYTVTAKNTDGCTRASSSLTVTAPASAPATPVTNVTQPTCTSSTGSITVTSPTGSGLTYSINGTNFQATTTFNNLAPATYTVTVRDASGCSNTGTVTINAVSSPAVPTVTTVQPTCSMATGSITVTSPTGTGFTYSIDGTNFQTSPIFNSLAPNTYTVTVKNSSNCTNTTTATITASFTMPVPTFSITQPTCTITTGSVSIISPIGNTFEYSIDGTNFSFMGTFTGLVPNTYTMTVRNQGGCSNNAPFTINTIPSAPTAPTVTTPVSLCQNSAATTLTATGSNLLWYTSASGGAGSSTAPTPSTATVGSTVYYVSQSINGCESARISLTVDIIASPPAPTILANGATSFCEQGSVTLSSSTAINIQWYRDGAILNGSTNVNYTATLAGTYTVTVTGTNNCTATSTGTTVTIFPNPSLSLNPNILVNENDSAKLLLTASQGNLFTYLWSPGIYLNDATVAQPWTKPLMDTYYTVTVTNENGCIETTGTTVTLLKEIIVPNAFSPNGDNVNDKWEIPNLSANPYCLVEVFARSGQLVYTSVGYSKPWDGTRNGKPVPVGVYYYIINMKNGKPVKSGNVTLLR